VSSKIQRKIKENPNLVSETEHIQSKLLCAISDELW
jgi:hypothetical protein